MHPAARCDLDHNLPFDRTGHGRGGATAARGMAVLARFPHRGKTHGDYALTHHDDGTITWTTPLGRSYDTHPHDYRPDPPPQPPPDD